MAGFSPLETLLLLGLLSVAGGYGGRALAVWNERKARLLMADQLNTLLTRFSALRQDVDEQLDGFNRRIAKREGAVGQAKKKENAAEEEAIAKALQEAVEREKRGRQRQRDPDDSEIEEALANIAAAEKSKKAASPS